MGAHINITTSNFHLDDIERKLSQKFQDSNELNITEYLFIFHLRMNNVFDVKCYYTNEHKFFHNVKSFTPSNVINL